MGRGVRRGFRVGELRPRAVRATGGRQLVDLLHAASGRPGNRHLIRFLSSSTPENLSGRQPAAVVAGVPPGMPRPSRAYHEQRDALPCPRSAGRRSTPGSSPSPWSSPRSWRCWTPRSPTSPGATSPAACRRRMNDSEWVMTSYLAANATILPITGWLSAHLGRRNYFLLSIAVFTVASGLCGLATSLEQLILFRVIQGLAGGGLQPSSQGDPARRLPAREAGHGHDDVRRRGPDRPRSSARRWAATSRSTTTGAGSSTSTSRSASSAS